MPLTDDEKMELWDSRSFKYYFFEGDEVQIDEILVNNDNGSLYWKQYLPYVGKRGTVIKIYSDLHSFSRGSSYSARVDFGNGVVLDMMCGLLKKYIKK